MRAEGRAVCAVAPIPVRLPRATATAYVALRAAVDGDARRSLSFLLRPRAQGGERYVPMRVASFHLDLFVLRAGVSETHDGSVVAWSPRPPRQRVSLAGSATPGAAIAAAACVARPRLPAFYRKRALLTPPR